MSEDPRYLRVPLLTHNIYRSVLQLPNSQHPPHQPHTPTITMARKYLIGGNWKCNGTTESVAALVRENKHVLLFVPCRLLPGSLLCWRHTPKPAIENRCPPHHHWSVYRQPFPTLVDSKPPHHERAVASVEYFLACRPALEAVTRHMLHCCCCCRKAEHAIC